jgi:hypothetical protein
MRTSMTTEQLAEWMIEQINRMSPDEKAHVRYHLLKSIGRQRDYSGKPN